MNVMFIFSFLALVLFQTYSIASVKLDKYYILMEGTQRNESLYISNGDKNAIEGKRYSVDFVNYKQMADGSYKEAKTEEANNKFADGLLLVSPRRFTLEPGGSQIVKIYRKPFTETQQDGEYKTHLRIQEIPEQKPIKGDVNLKKNQLAFEITGIFGVTIPVIVHKGMNLSATAEISKAEYVMRDNQPYVDISIGRFGNRHITGSIVVEDDKGNEITRANGFTIFTSTDIRHITLKLEKKIKGNRLVVKYINGESSSVIALRYIYI